MEKLFPLAVFLLSRSSSFVQGGGFVEKVQKEIEGMFSLFARENAPVLINLNCDLRRDFLETLVASQLSLSASELYTFPRWDITTKYSKVFVTSNKKDRFNLGLTCHMSRDEKIDFFHTYIFTRGYESLLPKLRIPSHSLVLLWITDHLNFSTVGSRAAAPFTQIYAFFDSGSRELTLRATKSAIEKWYDPFLQLDLDIGTDQMLERFELEDLKFGSTSYRNFRIKSVSIEQFSGLDTYVELHDPDSTNVSLFVKVWNLASEHTAWDVESNRVSSHRSFVAVAVVPSTSKSGQVISSFLRMDIWALLLVAAFSATLCLRSLNEEPVSTFFGLVLCVIFPVKFDFQAKPKQFLLIVGVWILLLQVIGICFRGEIVASIQSLPSDRLTTIEKCEPFAQKADGTTARQPVGYTDINLLPVFVGAQLPRFLRGMPICKDVRGLDFIRESLLRNVPTYQLNSGQDTVASSHVRAPSVSFSREALERASYEDSERSGAFLDPHKLCCSRLAQLALAYSLFQQRYVVHPISYDREALRAVINLTSNPSLSPNHFTELCVDFNLSRSFLGLNWTVRKSLTRETTGSCFLLDDLQPRTRHVVLMKDFFPALHICAFPLIIGVVCFFSEAAGHVFANGRNAGRTLKRKNSEVFSRRSALCVSTRRVSPPLRVLGSRRSVSAR